MYKAHTDLWTTAREIPKHFHKRHCRLKWLIHKKDHKNLHKIVFQKGRNQPQVFIILQILLEKTCSTRSLPTKQASLKVAALKLAHSRPSFQCRSLFLSNKSLCITLFIQTTLPADTLIGKLWCSVCVKPFSEAERLPSWEVTRMKWIAMQKVTLHEGAKRSSCPAFWMLYGLPAHRFSAPTNAVPEKCAIVLTDLWENNNSS